MLNVLNEKRPPSSQRGPSSWTGLTAPAHLGSKPGIVRNCLSSLVERQKTWLAYFFLVGFLVAFFFIVLFSLGLDLLAALPGFLIGAIQRSSSWFAAAGRASETDSPKLQLCAL
jgi:hypothetical protein